MRKLFSYFSIFAVLSLIAVVPAQADAGKQHPQIEVKPSAAFDSLKQLAGTWEGKTLEQDGTSKPAKVTYRLSSGGRALVETIDPSGPCEMESIYFNRDGQLTMTHYCALGNRPVLALDSSDSKSGEYFMNFDASASGIDAAKEPHMHSLKITMPDANTLRQEWTYYEGGKQAGVTVFDLKRVS